MRTELILLSLLFVVACATVHKQTGKQISTPVVESDSISYELIVLDPGFESWYTIHNDPTRYHSQEYYELWNDRYVKVWNSGSLSRNHDLIGIINYDSNIDYGFEINQKLFAYFRYVEKVLGIPILKGGPAGF